MDERRQRRMLLRTPSRELLCYIAAPPIVAPRLTSGSGYNSAHGLDLIEHAAYHRSEP